MAMIRRCCDAPLPNYFSLDCPYSVFKEFFHSDGRLRDDELSRESRKFVREIKPIRVSISLTHI
jgi:hypothetical protein